MDFLGRLGGGQRDWVKDADAGPYGLLGVREEVLVANVTSGGLK